ncbi:MerR family transcriptional regulator [Umezawaea sp. Da 62-37]|uniref:MerR family transcriptional regulator n=1 Tax=Umezawaea sp. Da 62-37 TaxID=3075927 RepID=UPI0028F71684|nr:MerR family transcriptional regulator [Umezawaea sp. Da 62-37]WNV85607.1 MerR family transcriptional regulator [Umezawaea sp. Da 62-37]
MRVSELADRSGVSARSVRHYDRAGLLDSTRRANGYRDFAEQDVARVRVIERLLSSGLTVDDVVTLRPCLTAVGEFTGCPRSRDVLAAHVDRLRRAIARDQRTLLLLRERQRNMTPADRAG